MSCEYCSWKKDDTSKPFPLFYGPYGWPTLVIDGSNLQIDKLEGFLRQKRVSKTVPIAYCPICGRKLGDSNDL